MKHVPQYYRIKEPPLPLDTPLAELDSKRARQQRRTDRDK